jgi:hypothetical protein
VLYVKDYKRGISLKNLYIIPVAMTTAMVMMAMATTMVMMAMQTNKGKYVLLRCKRDKM